jgi:hypothetical protein
LAGVSFDLSGEPVAAVVYEAPHGTDGMLITAGTGPVVAFGRGGDCPIRFGYAPRVDAQVPRRAGAFLAAAGRLAVESPSKPGPAPLQVRAPGRPPVELAPGELYAPGTVEFDVVIRGERDWVMTVRRRYRVDADLAGSDADGPTTRGSGLELTDHERRVLAAYLAPMRAGRLEPATHADVAGALHFSANKVRGDLYGIWAKMIAHGVVVPGYADKRMAVTHAAMKADLYAG